MQVYPRIMATMNIKDPEVHRLAHELATKRHTSATGAVRDALREALQREEHSREGLSDWLMEIGRRSATRPEPFLTDEDLYDDHGLPK